MHPAGSDFSDMLDLILELRREVAGLKRDLANIIKHGRVCDIDAEKGFRLEFVTSEQGDVKKSAWLPFPEQGAVTKTWMPLYVGQNVSMLAPPGDTRQSVLLRGGFCDQYEQPSHDLEEVVLLQWDDGSKCRVFAKDDKLTIRWPKIVLEGIVYEGGTEEECTREVSARGTIDTSNDREIANFLTKVWGH